jgi:hypothetical protein
LRLHIMGIRYPGRRIAAVAQPVEQRFRNFASYITVRVLQSVTY